MQSGDLFAVRDNKCKDAYKSSIVNGEKFKEKIEAYGDAFEEVLEAATHNTKALIKEKVLVDGDQFINGEVLDEVDKDLGKRQEEQVGKI